MTNRKSKDKAKTYSCNVVSISSRETKEDVVSLTNLEEQEFALAIDQNTPPISKTWFGKQYLKKYNDEQSMKQPMKKHKELHSSKAL